MDGALIIDKPAGLTSHDVVARARRLLGERSVGHLGTLDPAATGVLPLLVGRLTRLAQFLQGRDKEYEGTIAFGFATSTYDAQGKPLGPCAATLPALPEIEAALAHFRGPIRQTPPPFSAKKIAGVRAYKLARRDLPVELKPVDVEIHEFQLRKWEAGRLRIRVVCSSGTYVRSLAHDLGQALGVGAHLVELRRTRSGEFGIATAVALDQVARGNPAGWVRPQALLPEFPNLVVPPETAAKLLQGRAANLAEFSPAERVKVFAAIGTAEPALIAVARRLAGSLFQPQIVFPLS
ncbi:MAG: tRNA pseudouridine(55) synthase TruB [Terriglobales bacterium]